MTFNKLKKIAFLSLIAFLLSCSFSFAQRTQLNYPQFPGIPAWAGGVVDFFRYLYQIFLAAGAILAFGFFVWGGFLYLTSAGNPARMGKAKELMTSSLLGLFILFASYTILSTIDPSLTMFDIQIFRFALPKTEIHPSPKPETLPSCYKIPLQSFFEAIQTTEKEALSIGKQIEELVFGTSGRPSRLTEIIEEIRDLTKQCQCSVCGNSVCLAPDAGCPECPAFCPASVEDPCPQNVRDQINNLLNQLKEQGLDPEVDLISLLEEKIRKLTELKIDFEKYRREATNCREDKNLHLWACLEAKDKLLNPNLDCRELDFYCCP